MIAPGVTIAATVPPAIVQRAPAVSPAAGAVVGRVVIPRLGLSVPFRHGIGGSVLAKGPGHYPGTSLPGGGGTIAIAGHRVTHTRPFLALNRLRKGDGVVLVLRGRRYTYRVFTMRIVPPHQVWPLRSRGGEQLVLTACHPPRTDALRLVVFARRSTR